jgi:hypothetical protein
VSRVTNDRLGFPSLPVDDDIFILTLHNVAMLDGILGRYRIAPSNPLATIPLGPANVSNRVYSGKANSHVRD